MVEGEERTHSRRSPWLEKRVSEKKMDEVGIEPTTFTKLILKMQR